MTNKKSTKKALLSSILSLVLCLTMLIGTTFAWFTDSVTSSNNIIKSGNLDVELYYQNSETSDWTKVNADTNVFKADTLWEPGHTEVVKFKVVNEGSLALKYQFGVNIASETGSVNKDGKDFKLSDYIYFDVVEGAQDYTRATAIAAVKDSAVKINAGYTSKEQSLEANKGDASEATMTMVVYMPETVGNEANYAKGEAVPQINLGVNLFATQYTSEYDSFGPEYDEGAVYADKVYTVDATADFADVLADINAATDKTVLIELDKDVEWATGAEIGSTPWVDADAAVENLIIDGNGKTITATGKGVGQIRMANGGTLTIKNATIVDKSVSYAEGNWEYGYLEFGGNIVFENVNFVNAMMMETQTVTFKNCTFNSNVDNEYAVWIANGDAYFTGCTFTGPRGLKTHEDYGSEVGKIVVDNCTFDNIIKKPGVVIGTVNADTTIVIKNSDFINCQPGDQGKYIYESDTTVTTFNFDCSENNEIIKSVTPDLTISTKEQLFAFANDVNVNGNSYAGKLVVLGADIDLNNEEWTPIGQTGGNDVATYFQGMFDGKGYTISNLKITNNANDEGANYAAGLFGFIDAADAQIVNLKVDKASVSAHHWTGVIAGYLSGKITGCTVTNATVTCTHANSAACGDKAGVITGYVNSGVVTGNTVKDCTVTAGRDAGQVVGTAKTTQAYGNTIYNVTVTATGDCTGANVNNAEIGRIN